MIEFYLLPGTPLVVLDDYNELFNFICSLEGPNKPGDTDWSFIIHSPNKVASLYDNRKQGSFAPAMNPEIRQAYDEQLDLLEIRSGDHTNPRYVALTPSANMDGLKKKWCDDYCVFHNIDIRETIEEEINAPTAEEGV
jgi:hypothetical protein